MTSEKRLLAIRIALSACALEFFGPILRDFRPSHAMNPTWVGHARVHLVWLLGFMFLSGIVNIWLVWRRSASPLFDLRVSALWQSCNLGGFWISYVLAGVYGGEMTMPGIHTHIFGIDENVFAFTLLSVLLAGVWVALLGAPAAESRRAVA